ncbi:hypothetical protein KBY24_20825 [Ruegeria pomeroyi]|nr:hypothetical protein [Ruegeria pomeroyi]MCE8535829.1 hypothetical protein [Ruegeria pomeroyi]
MEIVMVTYSMTPVSGSVDEDAGSITFTITRSGDLPAETIYFSTLTNEGYSNNGDYTGIVNRAVNFSSGVSTATVSITDDSSVESNERFAGIIQRNSSDPVSTYLDRSTFTIVNDDAAPVHLPGLPPPGTGGVVEFDFVVPEVDWSNFGIDPITAGSTPATCSELDPAWAICGLDLDDFDNYLTGVGVALGISEEYLSYYRELFIQEPMLEMIQLYYSDNLGPRINGMSPNEFRSIVASADELDSFLGFLQESATTLGTGLDILNISLTAWEAYSNDQTDSVDVGVESMNALIGCPSSEFSGHHERFRIGGSGSLSVRV